MTDVIYAAIRILAGFGAFLLGFKLLGDNLERIAGNGLKTLFDRSSGKTPAGVGLGAVTTAVVQSSSVTVVMVIGFVNSGVMSLGQATSVVLGANIGSCVTAQIAALQSFDAAAVFMALVLAGVFVEKFSSRDRVKSCGLALAGFGLVFLGLDVLSLTLRTYMQAEGAAWLTEPVQSLSAPSGGGASDGARTVCRGRRWPSSSPSPLRGRPSGAAATPRCISCWGRISAPASRF